MEPIPDLKIKMYDKLYGDGLYFYTASSETRDKVYAKMQRHAEKYQGWGLAGVQTGVGGVTWSDDSVSYILCVDMQWGQDGMPTPDSMPIICHELLHHCIHIYQHIGGNDEMLCYLQQYYLRELLAALQRRHGYSTKR